MLATVCTTHLQTVGRCLRNQIRRNFGASAVIAQKAEDQIQQLFVDKIREYAQKKKAAGGGMVDANEEVSKALEFELERLKSQYRTEGQDMTKFPKFAFTDAQIDTLPAQESTEKNDLPL